MRPRQYFSPEELKELRKFIPGTQYGDIAKLAKRFNRLPSTLYTKLHQLRTKPQTFAELMTRLRAEST